MTRRAGLDDVRHEAIVCVRLRTTVAGSHLLEHLRAQRFVEHTQAEPDRRRRPHVHVG